MTDEEAVRSAKAKLMERYGLNDISARLMLAHRADKRRRTLGRASPFDPRPRPCSRPLRAPADDRRFRRFRHRLQQFSNRLDIASFSVSSHSQEKP